MQIPPSIPLRIVILDDNPETSNFIERALTEHPYEVLRPRNSMELAEVLTELVPDVLMVYGSALEEGAVLADFRAKLPDVGLVLIITEAKEKLARRAYEEGVDQLLVEPFLPISVAFAVREACEVRYQRQRVHSYQRELRRSVQSSLVGSIVTCSDKMAAVMQQLEKVAPRDLPVLILGESGTGKELAAQAIHQASGRSAGHFVEVNCAALPLSLVESELFGHERGAFTGAIASRAGKFEQAHGGTLFLDEIGELSLEIQPKLLRALQERRITRLGAKRAINVDFRLICATNRDLAEEVEKGRFREDLYYRIAAFPLRLPPLRERMEDLDPLLAHFLQEGGERVTLTPRARAVLHEYSWPGNVRELRNFAAVIPLLAVRGVLEEAQVREHLGVHLPKPQTIMLCPPCLLSQRSQIRKLAELENEAIHAGLRICGGNVPEAAQSLGIDRATLYRYLQKHSIQTAQFTSAN